MSAIKKDTNEHREELLADMERSIIYAIGEVSTVRRLAMDIDMTDVLDDPWETHVSSPINSLKSQIYKLIQQSGNLLQDIQYIETHGRI